MFRRNRLLRSTGVPQCSVVQPLATLADLVLIGDNRRCGPELILSELHCLASKIVGADMDEAATTIDLMQRAKALSGAYENVILTKFNDHVVRMSRMEKAYFWHLHPNSDEIFLGVEGILIVELENQRIELGPGQVFTVARGVRHRTMPVGSYSVNLTFERVDMGTVPMDERRTSGAQRK
jgi:mannose-6-phosphate isomerase-like protein (cupin superfamily)